MKSSQLLARTGVLVALGVVASYVSGIPVLGAKLFPAQHAINVVAGVYLGPWYGGLVALAISAIRLALGTGTLLAFPGSLFGVFLAGLAWRLTRARLAAMLGEVVGTGLVGALAAYPIAVWLMGNARAAAAGAAFYIIPFALSSVAGALLGGLVLAVLGPPQPPQHRVPGQAGPHL